MPLKTEPADPRARIEEAIKAAHEAAKISSALDGGAYARGLGILARAAESVLDEHGLLQNSVLGAYCSCTPDEEELVPWPCPELRRIVDGE